MQPVKGYSTCARDRAGGAIGGGEGGELVSRLGRRPMLYEGGVKSSSQGLCATPHECQSGDVGRVVRPGKAAQAWLCTLRSRDGHGGQGRRGETTGRLRMQNAVVCESQGRRRMHIIGSDFGRQWHHRRMRPSARALRPLGAGGYLSTESIFTSPAFYRLYAAFQTTPRVRLRHT